MWPARVGERGGKRQRAMVRSSFMAHWTLSETMATGSAETVDCVRCVVHRRAMNDHERGFLTFLLEPTRRRMESLLELGEKRRRGVRALLDHSVRLDERFARHLTGSEASSANLESTLRKAGAPTTCYVLSANSELDARDMPFSEALEAIAGMGDGAFVSCLPGRLGFYEFEDAKSSYLLFK